MRPPPAALPAIGIGRVSSPLPRANRRSPPASATRSLAGSPHPAVAATAWSWTTQPSQPSRLPRSTAGKPGPRSPAVTSSAVPEPCTPTITVCASRSVTLPSTDRMTVAVFRTCSIASAQPPGPGRKQTSPSDHVAFETMRPSFAEDRRGRRLRGADVHQIGDLQPDDDRIRGLRRSVGRRRVEGAAFDDAAGRRLRPHPGKPRCPRHAPLARRSSSADGPIDEVAG